ncbi:glycoside hydrolase family 78 protein [Rathayibacter sp. VKM Ac-2857]|uniref:glycoside hydrolase family 78 protein n=1 Tax=Rathayibacter sp. VKM Ac-2857 TaxID=2739020 RepID=UPI001567BEE0|nr:glycoside hydrolase family 78 protein [Rathayibacter sp. VKM Ac-2857]NQX18239.1 family 78 glycoside hydrolase catalytic domain [Rathayibacter sp. VKM Ac-2857]
MTETTRASQVDHPAFISAGEPSTSDTPAVYFRKEFVVEPGLLSATLKITALGIVVPSLNGARVGDEVLAPGWTSYANRVLVSSYDVSGSVRTGPNALGAVVGEGWAVGPLTWELNRAIWADRPALWVRLELAYADRIEVVGSDDSFRVGSGAVRANGVYAGEDYDARLETDGWDSPGFDDSAWAPAQSFEWDLASLEEDVPPPIRRIEEIAPVSITTSPAGATIVDFGQILSGWVRLTVTGEAGRTVTLRHVELLTPQGEPEFETLRLAEATDRYTLRGGAEESWQPEFTFHGFRYVQVEGWPGTLTEDALRAVVVHSDMARTGWFETSDPLVTKLHQNTVWSMRGNFVGIPTDCPQRDERLGWTGDINAFAPTAAYLYDVRGVLGSWLKDLAIEQKQAGTVPWIVPTVLAAPSTATALWSDVAVSLPWVLFQEYGDLEILRSSYESMTSFVVEVEGQLDEGGLWSSGFQFGDWLDPDAPSTNPSDGKTDRYLVASAYLVKTTREMADTAGLLGEVEDEKRFRALHERVTTAFRREYVAESGRLVNETATAYALAITFEILDGEQKRRAGEQLAAIVAKAGYRISTGFAGTPLLTDALTLTGHLKEAYALLQQTEAPSFLYPLTMGATTIWERWDAVLPDGSLNSTGMTSLNHYALGAVADWLHRVVGGLQRTEPGWRRFRVAPQPGGELTWARTAHETPHGRAEIVWRAEGGEVSVELTVPQGTSATVVLPLHPDGLTEEVGPGSHSWRYSDPTGYGGRPLLTTDTPLGRLRKDAPQVWDAILEVMRIHYPGIPVAAAGSQFDGLSIADMLKVLPAGLPGAEDALQAALDAGNDASR